jgi:hypothetical protein
VSPYYLPMLSAESSLFYSINVQVCERTTFFFFNQIGIFTSYCFVAPPLNTIYPPAFLSTMALKRSSLSLWEKLDFFPALIRIGELALNSNWLIADFLSMKRVWLFMQLSQHHFEVPIRRKRSKTMLFFPYHERPFLGFHLDRGSKSP